MAALMRRTAKLRNLTSSSCYKDIFNTNLLVKQRSKCFADTKRQLHVTSQSFVRDNAEIEIPYDPAYPNRKTTYNMSIPIIPSHQKIYESPSEEELTKSLWTPNSKRIGVVALKCGMIPEWDKWGQRFALTVLRLEDVRVIQVKQPESHSGVLTVQIGGGDAKPKRVTKALKGHFNKAGVVPKIELAEFKVTPDALVEPGTQIFAQHFIPGQFVDVTARSTGKGFAGVMKRWNFAGQGASHGNSKAHRALGGTGAGTYPGKVWKGKKMPGRMGGNNVTVQALQVYKIDLKRNLIYLKGAVPGKAGTYVKMRDSIKKDLPHAPPFPTYYQKEEDLKQLEKWSTQPEMTPTQILQATEKNELPRDFEAETPYEIVMPPPDLDPFSYAADNEPEV